MVGVIVYLPRQCYARESGSNPRALSLVHKSNECPYEDGCVPLRAFKWKRSALMGLTYGSALRDQFYYYAVRGFCHLSDRADSLRPNHDTPALHRESPSFGMWESTPGNTCTLYTLGVKLVSLFIERITYRNS
jgi:hypothetical protein